VNYWFALASRTAARKNHAPKGKLKIKIIVVARFPNLGIPEVNSKMEPTAAIKATQELPRNRELLGVTV